MGSECLLIIGLDGATFDLLTPWMDAGYLPTLDRLRQSGSQGELASTMPPVTAPAWVSFMTGKSPTTHGIHDFFVSNPDHLDQFRMVNSSDIQAQTLWEMLSDAGKSVGVLNVPVTHPPRPVKGYMIPGLLSPDNGQTTFPANLLDDISENLGAYRVTPDVLYRPKNIQPFIDDLIELTERQIAYAQHFARTQPTDVMMLHFFATDSMQHKLWHTISAEHPWHTPALGEQFGNALRDLFIQIDSGIADLLALLPGDPTVLIMSDHGFGPQHNTVNLNLVLAQAGLLTFKPGIERRLRRVMSKNETATAIGQRLFRRKKLLSFEDIDWSQTQAYSLGHMGQIHVNLCGRQAHGCVEAPDYDAVCEQVSAAVSRIPDANGQLLSATIIRAAQSPPARGPDLHVCIDGYRSNAYPMFAADGNILTEQRSVDSGHHRANGILLASGVNIRPNHQIQNARLIDLAPTILHLLNLSIPDDLDGHVLTDLLTPEYMAAGPIRQHPAAEYIAGNSAEISQSEQNNIADRLRSLGYLDT